MTAANPHPELIDDVDVDAVARAVRSCAGVDDLDGGPLATIVSYLPGRRLYGIAVDDDRVTIAIRAQWGTVLPQLGGQIRTAVTGLVGHRTVDVLIGDLADPPGASNDASATDASAEDATAEESEVTQWTTMPTAGLDGPSSAPTTPTPAATPMPS